MGSFTTGDFIRFGNAKEKKHFVDLNLFHEALSFPVFSQAPSFGSFLTLQPLLLPPSSVLHLKLLPLEIGFTSSHSACSLHLPSRVYHEQLLPIFLAQLLL